jgi:hypothetical protein
VVVKKTAKQWVTGYPIGRHPDLHAASESGFFSFRFRPKLAPKRVALNKLLDFDGKKYL